MNQSTKCTLIYGHHPRWTSGQHLNDSGLQPLWDIAYQYNVDVILKGHDHDYERFHPMGPTGNRDATRGIDNVIVGTGGTGLRGFEQGILHPSSLVRNSTTWGVLKMTLNADSYSAQFLPIAGQTFTDSWTRTCH